MNNASLAASEMQRLNKAVKNVVATCTEIFHKIIVMCIAVSVSAKIIRRETTARCAEKVTMVIHEMEVTAIESAKLVY